MAVAVAVVAAAEEDEEEEEVRGTGAKAGTAELRVWESVRGVAAAAVVETREDAPVAVAAAAEDEDEEEEATCGTSDGSHRLAFSCRLRLLESVNARPHLLHVNCLASPLCTRAQCWRNSTLSHQPMLPAARVHSSS